MKDELTEAMHSEFTVDEDTDQKHATWTALDVIDSGAMTKAEAMEEYGITEEDLIKYRPGWNRLNDVN